MTRPQLRRGCDEQIWNRRGSVLPALGECRLDRDGPVLDERREVLDGHRSDRRLGEECLVIATGSGGEADLETRHGADADEASLDPLRPPQGVGCEMEPADIFGLARPSNPRIGELLCSHVDRRRCVRAHLAHDDHQTLAAGAEEPYT